MSGLARKFTPLLIRRSSQLFGGKPIIASVSTCPRLLSSNAPAIVVQKVPYPHDAPERDYVNFPATRQAEQPAQVRLGFIPNEWFEAMYDKTGVTGPYLLVWGAVATALSKEYYVYWVDTLEHVVFFTLLVAGLRKFGPKVAASLDKTVDVETTKLKDDLSAEVRIIDKHLADLEINKNRPAVTQLAAEARRENVGLQLEAAYRERVNQVYKETKRRLDYQVAVQNVSQRLEKQEMLSFILGEVNKQIGGAKQERDFLQTCLGNLKSLAQKHAHAI